jgi:hypothetical protein
MEKFERREQFVVVGVVVNENGFVLSPDKVGDNLDHHLFRKGKIAIYDERAGRKLV